MTILNELLYFVTKFTKKEMYKTKSNQSHDTYYIEDHTLYCQFIIINRDPTFPYEQAFCDSGKEMGNK